MLQVGSLNQQWRNPLASCGNLQLLYRSQVLEGMVQHFHSGGCRPEEEEGEGYQRSPSFSGLSGAARLLSSDRLCWLGPGNCRRAYIRVPVPPSTHPLSKEAIANGSLCSSFQNLGVRILLHTVIGGKAYLPTSTVQGSATKFNQRSDRMADFKSLVILK